MTDQHPITPPPELIQQWWDGTHGAFYEFEAVATQAARWGADQELEACCAEIHTVYGKLRADWLRNHRRHKPPSLKELNLKHLEVMERDGHYLLEIIADLRRAIESLPS
jgi:hypothetical protein